MITNTSISKRLKSDFKAFEVIGENIYKLSWGKEDEVERVKVFNEETKKHEYTDQVNNTDYCTYESGIYTGVLTPYLLDVNGLDNRTRHASLQEYKDIYDGMGLSRDQQIPLLKEKLINEIDRYDKSDYVNSFIINGVSIWLDKATRSGLLLRFQSEQAVGKTETTLWYNGMSFNLPIEQAIQILYTLEVYASLCYDYTQQQKARVEQLTSMEDILYFKISEGYPEKLIFNVTNN